MFREEYNKTNLILYEVEKTSKFEILYISVLKPDPNKNEVIENLDILNKYMQDAHNNNTLFYMFYDIKKVNKMISTDFLSKLIKMLKNNKKILETNLIKTVIINSGLIVKSLCKIIFFLYTPVKPFEYANSIKEAKEILFRPNK